MTLRARLLVGMAIIAVVLVGVAVVVTRTTEANLVDGVDAQLRATNLVRFGGNDRRFPPGGGDRNGFSSLYVAVVRGDGVEVLVEPNLTGDAAPLPEVDLQAVAAAADGSGPAAFTAGSGSDLRYRALVRREQRGGGLFVLALPLADVDAAVDRLIRLESFATLVVLSVLALVAWWFVRLGVRPLRSMASTAAAIAAGDLTARVPEGVPGTETGELGGALNAMLGRIEQAFAERARSDARLRQFVADASHELRTPVTTIRGYAELYRVGGLADPDSLASAMGRTEAEAVRMGGLIEDLLVLARLDQGRPLERHEVDLGVLATDAAKDARAVDPGRPITVRADEAVIVLGDDARLRQVVANLVGNALVHTPPGTPVELHTRREGERAVLEVVDAGPGMPEEVATRAFERFYRADPARSRHSGGSGLGLSIVQATVEASGGTVSLWVTPGSGTTVRIDLPRAPAAGFTARSGPALGDF